MPRPLCSDPPHPSPDGLVATLADRLVAAHADGTLGGAALVRARATPSGIDLAVLPLPAAVHPADALLGTEVPRRWTVSGVVAEGRAVAGADGEPRPVAVAVLVDRAGRVAHRAQPLGDAPPLPLLDDPPRGRLVDLLLRSLRLPTPPPDGASGPWWATLWLDRVVAAVAADPTAHRTLLALAALHPLVGPGLPPRAALALHRIAPAASVAGWEVMRRALAAADDPASGSPSDHAVAEALRPLVPPALARWHDQGSFARALVGALPPRPVLLAAAEALLPPRLGAGLRAAVGEPEVPDPPPGRR